jgi:hypothetical protein
MAERSEDEHEACSEWWLVGGGKTESGRQVWQVGRADLLRVDGVFEPVVGEGIQKKPPTPEEGRACAQCAGKLIVRVCAYSVIPSR